jgi:MerR family transcriptional regulator/heat shock protein HspR
MNLEGIRHVMQLEDEIAQLRALVVQLQEQLTGRASTEVLRGELVPLRQAVAVFRERPSIFNKDRY